MKIRNFNRAHLFYIGQQRHISCQSALVYWQTALCGLFSDFDRSTAGNKQKKASEESEFFPKNCCLENQTQGNTKRQSFLFNFII